MKKLALMAALAALVACQPKPDAPASESSDAAAPAITNRIDIPPQVVSNLGITFAKVERRRVAQTLRVAGVFESPPEATRVYMEDFGGRYEPRVSQYQRVAQGDRLYDINSPELIRAGAAIVEAQARAARLASEHAAAGAEAEALNIALKAWPVLVAALNEQIEAAQGHVRALQGTLQLWSERVAALIELDQQGGGRAAEIAEARAQHADAQAKLSEALEKRASYGAQLAEQQAAFDQDRARAPVLAARTAAAKTDAEAADKAVTALKGELAARLSTNTIEAEPGIAPTRRAMAPGIVTRVMITPGGIVAAGTPIVEVLDDSRTRFRARALQSDIALLKDGLEVSVVPPTGGTVAAAQSLKGKLTLAPEADADSRTFDLIVTFDGVSAPWARPGVSAEAEIVYAATAEEKFAIPLGCVVQDGLNKVIFKRDRDDPKKVIRLTPQFGPSDGRWIVVETDVFANDETADEVVLNGAYELKLTGSGKPSGKGHFHADGTYHEGDH